ncbi:phage antirepressor [Commensalibacter nepenthis]|uniref:Phage antirepressor n=1 Tax=Commensalibacter nepenthis TaxID=3043872 RepID=A0ABT6QA12_9PROT|nr:phage antirepressor [Commensalibacter sp. TBRC 10068]MDI2113073.1 phage antirepressor [Commensalibacter sp. TBRC 10068]
MNNQNISNLNSIIPFTFENTSVRVVNRDGEAWFVGADVAKALGYANAQKAIQTHCKAAENCKSPVLGDLGIEALSPRGLILIPERDVYRLVMRSKLPSAEQFEEKVVGEILPSIRKTGGYMATIPDETPEQTLSRALLLAKNTMDRQTQEIAQLKPKADGYDLIATSDGSMCITNAAKYLQIKPKALFDYLKMNGWIYRRAGGKNWIAYQDKLQQVVLEHKVSQLFTNDGESRIREQVLVTPKGIAKLAQIFSTEKA